MNNQVQVQQNRKLISYMVNNQVQYRVGISGLEPGLLLHNPRSSNPLDPASKKLNAVKKEYQSNKNDENLIEYLNAQWNCAIYWNEGQGCYIPRGMVQASMIGAAKKTKQEGKRSSIARIISGAISPKGDAVLEISEPHKTKTDLETLRANINYNFVIPVSIGTSLVPASRPLFKQWKATLTFNVLDETLVPLETFKEIVEDMGSAGFGDWRPSGPTPGEFGMFSIEKFESSSDGGQTWQKV